MNLSDLQEKVNRIAEKADGDPHVLTNVDPNRGYNVYDVFNVRLFQIEDEDDLSLCRVSDAEIGDEFVMIDFYQ